MRFWRDADRRRAAALSLVAHLCVLLLFVLWLSQPRPVPLEQFLVIDVGTPMEADVAVNAPTVEQAAVQTPTPQVEDPETGEPQARAAEERVTAAPEEQPRTAQPQPQPLQAEARTSDAAEAAQPATEPELADSDEPPIAPVPQPRPPAASASPELPLASNRSVLPEIEEVELEPRPAEQAIRIPQPSAVARVPEATAVAVTPSVNVEAQRTVPTPSVAAEVSPAQPVPRPQAQADVAAAAPIPQPQVTPRVAAPAAIPRPQTEARVTAAQPVPMPSAAAQVAAPRAVPLPGAQAEVAEARPLDVAAQVAVSRPQQVPTPSVRADVSEPEAQAGAAMAGAAPQGPSPTPSNRVDERPSGGNAPRTGQDRAQPDAQAEALGRAAGPAGGQGDGAESRRPRIPYRERLERPLAVILDNAQGYPQAGLPEASLVAEMPVEGGLTRLMAFYDRSDPAQVGPIRSARDYLVELARRYDGVLVHDGGSPAALAVIDRSDVATFNAYRFGDLFSRLPDRSAPYNLYSSGRSLREAVNRFQLDRAVEMSGEVPRPPSGAAEVNSFEVRFGGAYRSGFSYIRELDIYRWRRNGENAVDHRGEAVLVEAVLLARIDARAIPDDPAGRLYIPLRGGDATLYLRGKAIEGRWQPGQSQGQGVTFVRSDGVAMDLTPFRTWMLFAPSYAELRQD